MFHSSSLRINKRQYRPALPDTVQADSFLPIRLRKSMHKAAIAILPLFLAACGGSSSNGDGSSASGSGTTGNSIITLSGLVASAVVPHAKACTPFLTVNGRVRQADRAGFGL
jgi:hypothetical protein